LFFSARCHLVQLLRLPQHPSADYIIDASKVWQECVQQPGRGI